MYRLIITVIIYHPYFNSILISAMVKSYLASTCPDL